MKVSRISRSELQEADQESNSQSSRKDHPPAVLPTDWVLLRSSGTRSPGPRAARKTRARTTGRMPTKIRQFLSNADVAGGKPYQHRPPRHCRCRQDEEGSVNQLGVEERSGIDEPACEGLPGSLDGKRHSGGLHAIGSKLVRKPAYKT